MNSIFELIKKVGIVPVVKIENPDYALDLSHALCEGGIPIIEITFRTDKAYDAMKNISSKNKNIIIGAGTVLNTDQVDKALDAGAKFIVSPGFNEKVVGYCVKKNVPIVPGCITPSEIEKALEMGINILKFFPAASSGGIGMIKDLSAPYSNILFMPTGGVSLDNMNEYLSSDKVIACGGTFIAKEDLIKSKDFDKIKELAQKTVSRILDLNISHVGSYEDNDNSIKSFSDIFSNIYESIDDSLIIKNIFEVRKTKEKNNKFIAFSTISVERTIYHLENRKVEFDFASIKKDKNDNIIYISLKNKISDFEINLIKK